ncbi:PREDICTED: uncharacterized protein LOC109193525 [Ipomoea nil]|uniref:uncharacterized protein LOC109193525 n=1 Tax=Ipomoea nil TaxID=35883 RepID=UPI000900E60F|nr:PREDICTED: uncharacterized protein LOC109193525 [Ipomoea nil]
MDTRSRSQAPPTALSAQVCPSDPTCYTQAVKYLEWREDMDQEFNALLQNQTWCLIPSRAYMNVIGCKWVFRRKRKANGSIERHKAILVAKGFNQVPGHDFFDTFNPMVKPTTVRLLLSLALSSGWVISDQDLVTHLIKELSTTFKIRDLGEPDLFLGIETIKCDDGILLSQQRYMNDILKRVGMAKCKALSTPISVLKYIPFSADLYEDPTQYRSLVGALHYLTITRPDLSFIVNQLCQHMHAPTVSHWEHLKGILRYVKGTIDFGLRMKKSTSRELHAFSDSDWAGCPEDHKSTSGFAVFLGPNLISWVCKKQRTIVKFSTGAEYKALADVCAEVMWKVSLLREIKVSGISVPKLWCDNLGAIYMCANHIFHAHTKHVEIDYHFVRDKVAS